MLSHPLMPRGCTMRDNRRLIDLVGLLHEGVADVDQGTEIGICSRVVDENIERTEVLDRSGHQAIRLWAAAHVRRHGQYVRRFWKASQCFNEILFATRRNHDVGSRAHQSLCNGESDSPRGPCY